MTSGKKQGPLSAPSEAQPGESGGESLKTDGRDDEPADPADAASSHMPIRSKLMLGLLVLSITPLIVLGWFVCERVGEAQRSAVIEVQKVCHRGTENVYGLSRQAAKQRGEQISAAVVAFLEKNPDAPLCDLVKVKALESAIKQDVTTGVLTSVDVLLDDQPLTFLELAAPSKDVPVRSAGGMRAFHAQPVGIVLGQDTKTRRRKPYTYIAKVRGTNLKIAVTTQDLGVESVVTELGATMQNMSTGTQHRTYQAMDDLKTVLVFGVIAIVVGVTVINGQVVRTITQPIGKLTAAARSITMGERDVDLHVGGGAEVQALAQAFKKATGDLREYAASLETKNIELDAARKAAEEHACELQEAQEEMMQMGKMSSLGRLVAGVAHEIDAPTGAMYNVSAAAARSLDTLVGGLGRLREMAPEDFAQFQHFLDVAVAQQFVLERGAKEGQPDLRNKLQASGVKNAESYAELLPQCRITDPDDAVKLSKLLEKYDIRSVFTGLLEIHTCAATSRSSADRITEIVRALKYYSHGDEDQRTKWPTDINRTIKDAAIILHNRIKRHADLELTLADGLPPVECMGGIVEVWVNLLTNACDAIEKKAPNIRGAIRINSFRKGEKVHVTVTDNGVPIPPEVVSKVFAPFFTTKPPGKGTGVGLSLVMGTVKRDGGAVALVAEKDGFKGFEITFPLDRADENAG